MDYGIFATAFNEGYIAFTRGWPEGDNPFDPDDHKETDRFYRWRAGWCAAESDARDSVPIAGVEE